MDKSKPVVLLILDGWGIAPPSKGNAVELAKKPNFDKYWKNYPHTELFAHGKYVGVPERQVGNSEAGHINIGAGRKVNDDVVDIIDDIKTGRFQKNVALLNIIKHVKKNKSSLHLMGLASDGQSPHANLTHLYSLIDLAYSKGLRKIYLHLFTDGRDSPPHASMKILKSIEENSYKKAEIVSIIGRYYAMDRGKNWARTKKAYDCLVGNKIVHGKSYHEAILNSYNRKITDEFIEPSVVCHSKTECSNTRIKDDDAVIFFNSRSDRARQLVKCFVQNKFNKMNSGSFIRKKVPRNMMFCALTDFGPDLDTIITAYPSADLKNSLPLVLKHKKQLYISETEKYAHVTYFINGGYADAVNGEDRLKILSPKVKSYAQKPEMSVYEITKTVKIILEKNKYDFITINFANPDMVGHTGDLEATVKAIEHCDKCLGILGELIKEKKGTFVITADHGNAEKMIDEKSGEKWTSHTTNKVPFILINDDHKKDKLKSKGSLANIAPTIYDLFNIPTKGTELDKSLII
jgi:2,3-bisphosphoglycerate-independent phosphoglycerate mutase